MDLDELAYMTINDSRKTVHHSIRLYRMTAGQTKWNLRLHRLAEESTCILWLVVAIVEKRVLTQKYFLSDASDTVFPYDRRCRSISLKLGMIGGGDVGSITNFWARIWRYFQNAGRCERTTSQTSTSNRRYACPHGNTAQEKKIADS